MSLVAQIVAMDSDASLPQLVEEVLRLHRDEVTVLLETWMSRFNAQLAGSWSPGLVSVATGDSRPGKPELPLVDNSGEWTLPMAPKESAMYMPSPSIQEAEEDVENNENNENNEKNDPSSIGAGTDRFDSSYLMARQTDRRIAQAFHKLGGWSFYGRGPRPAERLYTWAGFQACTQAVMSSQKATMFWAFVILTNSVYLGVHLEWSVDHPGFTGNDTFYALHLVYAFLFTLEVALRIVAWGCWALVFGKDWGGDLRLQNLPNTFQEVLSVSYSRNALCSRQQKREVGRGWVGSLWLP